VTDDSGLPTVGEQASVMHAFSQDDIAEFARLSGDTNPVHLDIEAAREMGFPGTIVHGMLAAGLISRLLGTVLPGPGTIYLSQHLRFRRPIAPDSTVVASVEVVSRRDDKPIFELVTTVSVGGDTAIEGNATVLVRKP
jgi:acyl dehydratase